MTRMATPGVLLRSPTGNETGESRSLSAHSSTSTSVMRRGVSQPMSMDTVWWWVPLVRRVSTSSVRWLQSERPKTPQLTWLFWPPRTLTSLPCWTRSGTWQLRRSRPSVGTTSPGVWASSCTPSIAPDRSGTRAWTRPISEPAGIRSHTSDDFTSQAAALFGTWGDHPEVLSRWLSVRSTTRADRAHRVLPARSGSRGFRGCVQLSAASPPAVQSRARIRRLVVRFRG